MSRTYDIELKCGCWISEDGGGGLMPCDPFGENSKCVAFKYFKIKRKMKKQGRYQFNKKEIKKLFGNR